MLFDFVDEWISVWTSGFEKSLVHLTSGSESLAKPLLPNVIARKLAGKHNWNVVLKGLRLWQQISRNSQNTLKKALS